MFNPLDQDPALLDELYHEAIQEGLDRQYQRERLYTKSEVMEILRYVYEVYDISKTSRFKENNLSNSQDAPDWDSVLVAIDKDIESFVC